jgi:hypothetical protein
MNTSPGYLVDNTWTCQCGAMNAAYRQLCGRCNVQRDTNELISDLDDTWESFDINDFLYNRDDR